MMDKADLCYVIDADGSQIGASLKKPRDDRSSRFMPLENTSGTNWAHKPYHYCAILQPDELQISRPYLSITSASLCASCRLLSRQKASDACCAAISNGARKAASASTGEQARPLPLCTMTQR
jgi:hypothetical protein